MRILSRLLMALVLIGGLGYGSYAFGKYVLSARLFGPGGQNIQRPQNKQRIASPGAAVEVLPADDSSGNSDNTDTSLPEATPLSNTNEGRQSIPAQPSSDNVVPTPTPYSLSGDNQNGNEEQPRKRRRRRRRRDTTTEVSNSTNTTRVQNDVASTDQVPARNQEQDNSRSNVVPDTPGAGGSSSSGDESPAPRRRERERPSESSSDSGNAAPRVPVDSGDESPAPRRRRERVESDAADSSPAPRVEAAPRRRRERTGNDGASPVPVPEGNNDTGSPVPVPG